jgi:hypothetical protein
MKDKLTERQRVVCIARSGDTLECPLELHVQTKRFLYEK